MCLNRYKSCNTLNTKLIFYFSGDLQVKTRSFEFFLYQSGHCGHSRRSAGHLGATLRELFGAKKICSSVIGLHGHLSPGFLLQIQPKSLFLSQPVPPGSIVLFFQLPSLLALIYLPSPHFPFAPITKRVNKSP